MKTITRLLCVGVFALAISSGAASAQTHTATLTGSAIDLQGAAVPGVKVVATNQGTKLAYTTQTSTSGVYTIPFLPVGIYTVSVEASGFKKLVSVETGNSSSEFGNVTGATIITTLKSGEGPPMG